MKRKGSRAALAAIGMACLMSAILCKGNSATSQTASHPSAQPTTKPAAIYTQRPFGAKEAATQQDEAAKAPGAPSTVPATRPATGPAAQRQAAKDLANLAAIWRELGSPYEAQWETVSRSLRAHPGSPDYRKDARDQRARVAKLKENVAAAQGIIEDLSKSGQLSSAQTGALRMELVMVARAWRIEDPEPTPRKLESETREEYLRRMREWEQAEEEISVWEWGTVQDRLKVRIGVLEALAKTRQVSPEVCEILVRAVSPDLDGKLEEDRIGAPGRGSKAADAVAKLQERLRSCVNELEDRTQMGDDPVRRTGQWTRIAMAWRLAGPPAPHGSVRQELVELWYEQASQARASWQSRGC